MQRPKPVVLCVLDGWGYRAECDDNAICQASTPVWNRLWRESPHAMIDASERHVGLPEGQMGNSEVGHMNLGAGRVVMLDLPRIDQAVASGDLAANPALQDFIAKLKQSEGACHLLGLLSPGGVHAHQAHLAALTKIIAAAGVEVIVHAFTDGRDTPPSSAKAYLDLFLKEIAGTPRIQIGTVGGRYFGMDRDQRWDRVQKAYDALVEAKGLTAATAQHAIDDAYARGETDEFILPTVIGGYRGMKDGDGILMGNFRADRARQILTSLLDPAFADFPRGKVVVFTATLGMVEYSTALSRWMPCLFPPVALTDMLGEVVSKAGLKQLRIAETEKYAHVTFFFNGGEERQYEGEERILVPSPKIATYDLQPEMSARAVTDKLVSAIESDRFDFIVVNYANTDMVGHSGDLQAAIRAVEAVDECLGRLVAAVTAKGGVLLITADHGNAELMRDPETGEAHTAHTLNRVPLVIVNPPYAIRAVHDGCLADIAPTLLTMMNLPQPAAMTGRDLVVPAKAPAVAVAE